MDRTPHRRRNRKRAPLKPCGHGVHPAAVGGAALYRLLGRADFVVALMASAMSALEWGAGRSPITVAPAQAGAASSLTPRRPRKPTTAPAFAGRRLVSVVKNGRASGRE